MKTMITKTLILLLSLTTLGMASHSFAYTGADKATRATESSKQRWKEGFVIPQHYRGESYQIQDYSAEGLPRPERNQQWYKIKGELLLVDLSNFQIVKKL